ncbi:unnamed protein product [Nesidiocoris tenuis]|uniref:Uncharacterized protein n=1 Tax=Nesidiocoris tenuis TaxID=355587 RepID=A0A6H5GY02_9HEMI|nr:unnamed protein product [Nesidiocoris tenuis]
MCQQFLLRRSCRALYQARDPDVIGTRRAETSHIKLRLPIHKCISKIGLLQATFARIRADPEFMIDWFFAASQNQSKHRGHGSELCSPKYCHTACFCALLNPKISPDNSWNFIPSLRTEGLYGERHLSAMPAVCWKRLAPSHMLQACPCRFSTVRLRFNEHDLRFQGYQELAME